MEHPIEQLRIEIWKEYCSPQMTPAQTEQRLIELRDLKATPDKSHTHLIYEAMKAELARPNLDMTALICSGDSTALATLAACRANGYEVPEKMSVVTIGDGVTMEFHNPPVTCVDVHVNIHVETALELIEEALNGAPPVQNLQLIEPILIERGTVAPPRTDI